MRTKHVFLGIAGASLSACAAESSAQQCQKLRVQSAEYTACEFDPGQDNIQLHLRTIDGEVYGDFKPLEKVLAGKKQTLTFAMNGGMYHKNRDPVGLYIEGGKEMQPLSTKPGEGNFHMLPNGVFWTVQDGGGHRAYVGTAEAYQDAAQAGIASATQSGPMLVIDGALHPRFIKDSDSRKIRNGVGMTDDGKAVFVISDTPVNFYDFASLFRDKLGAKNALYLDGTISRLYAKDIRRNDSGLPMGPIISVTVPHTKGSAS